MLNVPTLLCHLFTATIQIPIPFHVDMLCFSLNFPNSSDHLILKAFDNDKKKNKFSETNLKSLFFLCSFYLISLCGPTIKNCIKQLDFNSSEGMTMPLSLLLLYFLFFYSFLKQSLLLSCRQYLTIMRK